MRKLLFTLACTLSVGGLVAQEAPRKTVDPKVKVDPAAQLLVQKMLEAYGTPSMAKLKNAEIHTLVSIPEQQALMSQKILTAGEKVFIQMKMLGNPVSKGFNGKVAWSKESDKEAKVLTPGETTSLRSSSFESIVNPFRGFDKVELKAEKEFNGKPCHVLALSREGFETTWFLDKKTHLKQGAIELVKVSKGSVRVLTVYANYTEHEKGFKYADRIEVNNGMHKAVIRVKQFKVDVEMDHGVFEMPK